MQKLQIIIISRGLNGLLHQCLQQLVQAIDGLPESLKHRITVVDNASDPPYWTECTVSDSVQLIRFDQHQSFARANNIAARRNPADLYLLLNNDVLLDEETLVSMFEQINFDKQCGIVGSRLVFSDGTIQHSGVAFGAGKTGPYHLHRCRPSSQVSTITQEYQAITGACMMIRGAVWEQLNGLDEQYSFGLEDIDFCLRARQWGWRVFCVGKGHSLHFESMTPGRVELDVASRELFMKNWQTRYSIDG
ncbi:MAG: GT2 family glycosyltransferase [Parasphingorhabdus sp.]|jgi:GT2 family glycosyltransferase